MSSTVRSLTGFGAISTALTVRRQPDVGRHRERDLDVVRRRRHRRDRARVRTPRMSTLLCAYSPGVCDEPSGDGVGAGSAQSVRRAPRPRPHEHDRRRPTRRRWQPPPAAGEAVEHERRRCGRLHPHGPDLRPGAAPQATITLSGVTATGESRSSHGPEPVALATLTEKSTEVDHSLLQLLPVGRQQLADLAQVGQQRAQLRAVRGRSARAAAQPRLTVCCQQAGDEALPWRNSGRNASLCVST